MNPLFPSFCRPMGYAVMALSIVLPFVLFIMGRVTDTNLLFYKECVKLLLMMGALMIIFAYTKEENAETLRIRNSSTRAAIMLTMLFLFVDVFYKIFQGKVDAVDTSSFLIFLIINVLCLEFNLKKQKSDKIFHRD